MLGDSRCFTDKLRWRGGKGAAAILWVKGQGRPLCWPAVDLQSCSGGGRRRQLCTSRDGGRLLRWVTAEPRCTKLLRQQHQWQARQRVQRLQPLPRKRQQQVQQSGPRQRSRPSKDPSLRRGIQAVFSFLGSLSIYSASLPVSPAPLLAATPRGTGKGGRRVGHRSHAGPYG